MAFFFACWSWWSALRTRDALSRPHHACKHLTQLHFSWPQPVCLLTAGDRESPFLPSIFVLDEMFLDLRSLVNMRTLRLASSPNRGALVILHTDSRDLSPFEQDFERNWSQSLSLTPECSLSRESYRIPNRHSYIRNLEENGGRGTPWVRCR